MSLAARYGMKEHEYEIMTAYFNGNFEEKICMDPPKNLVLILESLIDNENSSENIKIKARSMIKYLNRVIKLVFRKHRPMVYDKLE